METNDRGEKKTNNDFMPDLCQTRFYAFPSFQTAAFCLVLDGK